MAAFDSVTLDAGEQLAIARRIELADVEKKQEQARSALVARHAQQMKSGISQAVDPAAAAANDAIRQVYVKYWQFGQEAVEDLAMSFLDFMLISGLAVVLIYGIRLVVGNFFGGGPKISFRGISLALVPGFGPVEGLYRTAKVIFIGLLSAAVWASILTAAFVATHPLTIIQAIFGAALDWLSHIFGQK